MRGMKVHCFYEMDWLVGRFCLERLLTWSPGTEDEFTCWLGHHTPVQSSLYTFTRFPSLCIGSHWRLCIAMGLIPGLESEKDQF